MGITNTVATIAGFIGPSVVGEFTEGNVRRLLYGFVFFIYLMSLAV